MDQSEGYYSKFAIADALEIPKRLKKVLLDVWEQKYDDLYEVVESNTHSSLQLSIDKVLDEFKCESISVEHHRFAWMAYTLGLASKPTFESYLKDDERAETALTLVEQWLNKRDCDSLSKIDLHKPKFLNLSEGSQALDESIDVFRNLLRVVDSSSARESLLEILDDCLEGYAIFPGSSGRRDLFNWWLVEVVPASWCCRTPNAIYTMNWDWPPKLSP